MARIVRHVSTLLGVDWQSHTPYRPQSSGQAEKMNHLLRLQMVKFGQEARTPWPQALPLALLRIQTKPEPRKD